MPIEIRLLQESDIPAALRLKELAKWNQTKRDWLRLLRLEPEGCFCATTSGQLVGTITTTTYGQSVAWVGMVLVDPDHRRRGTATALMKVATEYLSNAGIETIKLDATPAGRAVYESLGFREESLIERWEGIGGVDRIDSLTLDTTRRKELLAFDAHAFGVDRSELLELLIEDSYAAPQIATGSDDRLKGYALTRAGTSAVYVGPTLASDASVATNLLNNVLSQVSDAPVYIDLNTNFEDGRSILTERGFVKQRDLIRMSYGKKSGVGLSSSIFAIAGPELG